MAKGMFQRTIFASPGLTSPMKLNESEIEIDLDEQTDVSLSENTEQEKSDHQ